LLKLRAPDSLRVCFRRSAEGGIKRSSGRRWGQKVTTEDGSGLLLDGHRFHQAGTGYEGLLYGLG